MTPTPAVAQTSGSELLPCPFCGKDGDYFANGSVSHPDIIVHRVLCNCEVRPFTGWRATKAQAIAAWNRRAPLEGVEKPQGSLQPSASVPTEQTDGPVDHYRLRGVIDQATHGTLPLADDVTGLGIQARAQMQVEIADFIISHLWRATVAPPHQADDVSSQTEGLKVRQGEAFKKALVRIKLGDFNSDGQKHKSASAYAAFAIRNTEAMK
jgi:hypothetical protein